MSNEYEQPVPQGKYLPAVRHGDLIFTSGMTPRRAGILIYEGKIKVEDPIESHRDAVNIAATNTINAAQNLLHEDERISQILQLNVFLNTEEGFSKHSKIADFASEIFIKKLGPNCIGSRAAIGVSSLPANAPVEITIICTAG